MNHRTERQRECSACGDSYVAEIDFRPEDVPAVVRSDVWLDGSLYCPLCLDVLESR